MRDAISITENVTKFMIVRDLRQCTHVLLINAGWNECKARKVECFEAGSGGKRMSSVLTVLMLNSVAKFGWVAYLINVTRSSHITENTLHLLDKDQQISFRLGNCLLFL